MAPRHAQPPLNPLLREEGKPQPLGVRKNPTHTQPRLGFRFLRQPPLQRLWHCGWSRRLLVERLRAPGAVFRGETYRGGVPVAGGLGETGSEDYPSASNDSVWPRR